VLVGSGLLRGGVEQLKAWRDGMAAWLVVQEFESLRLAKGSMSLLKTDNPTAFTRANYVEILKNWESALGQGVVKA